MWDPNSITQDQLHEYRNAAEQAWGDDTRHPDFIGHPDPSAGQCYVTSRWLANEIGGNVGTKNGHYFWVSPDRSHVIDLTGDQFSSEPPAGKMNFLDGQPVDEEDEAYEPEKRRWQPGPIMFKRASHPLYKGFRIKSDPMPGQDRRDWEDLEQSPRINDRVSRFSRRANAALNGRLAKVSDLMGIGQPMNEPQAQEDLAQRYLHDTMSDLQMTQEPVDHEYKFFYGNGQLHVSPIHSHDELRDHSGTAADSNGPIAVGYVQVHGGDATWSIESNIAARGLYRVLKDYSESVGWKWNGMVGGDGQSVHDDFGSHKSVWCAPKNDHTGGVSRDEINLAYEPFRGARRIDILGRTAYYNPTGLTAGFIGSLTEWAEDFSYRLAEYPGGTDMTDRTKNWEQLNQHDLGDSEWEPEKAFDGEPMGPLNCGKCGFEAPDFNTLILHRRLHDGEDKERVQDGHFPQVNDRDDPLPLRRRNVNPTAQPIASFCEASQVDGFDLYAGLWNFDNDNGNRFYGGYVNGQMIGYGVVRPGKDGAEVVMIHSSIPNLGVGTAIANKMKEHYAVLYTHADSPEGERLAKRMGMVNVEGQLYKLAAGEEPKDMIQAPVPFIYDIQQDHITTGHPGMKTSDIMGQFTPGGIVEGYYEPGGKVVINTSTNMPYSTYHMMQLWYWSHPQMQITGLELEDQQGKRQKLASSEVGPYLKTLVGTDAAAWGAYQALRNAGGTVYAVGGAVRDALLGKDPKDIDLMVAGLPPEQVSHVLEQLPGRVDLTGKRFGVYRYRTKGQEVEVALPREDTYDGERRGQGKITVNPDLPIEDDLLRRDFTVNSMAVNLDSGQLIDPYEGAKDVETNTLRTTHPSSFEEDPTRLVRALVASSRHGLIPDEKTRQEMASNASRLDRESPDALKQQLDKLLESPNPAGALRLAHETGILQHLFPEVEGNYDYNQNNPHHNYSLGEHLINVLENASRTTTDPDIRLAALLHDIGKPASAWTDPVKGTTHYYQGMVDGKPVGADHALVGADMADKRLRETYNFPTARIRRVRELIEHHMFPAFSSPKGARKFLNRVGDHADDLLTLREADMTGKGQSDEEVAERTSADRMRNLVEQARSAGDPTTQSALSLNGNDIVALGVKPGPQIGQILRQLTNDVVENPALNDREALTQRAKEYIDALPV